MAVSIGPISAELEAGQRWKSVWRFYVMYTELGRCWQLVCHLKWHWGSIGTLPVCGLGIIGADVYCSHSKLQSYAKSLLTLADIVISTNYAPTTVVVTLLLLPTNIIILSNAQCAAAAARRPIYLLAHVLSSIICIHCSASNSNAHDNVHKSVNGITASENSF